MLLIHCPYCGPRPEIEFTHGGHSHITRPSPPESVSADEWVTFLYLRSNTRGVLAERWRHVHGCARFFNALRDTTTDMFIATYRCGESPPELTAQPRS